MFSIGDFARLNRVIAMKDVGFTLEQVGAILGVTYAREVCLEFDPVDPAKWVHELKIEVARA